MNSELSSYVLLHQNSFSRTSLNLQSVQSSYVDELDRIRNISSILLAVNPNVPMSSNDISSIGTQSYNQQNKKSWMRKFSDVLMSGLLIFPRVLLLKDRETFPLDFESETDFKIESRSTSESTSPNRSRKPDEAYSPKGVLGFLKISLKRYVLNIWDHNRTPQTWAKSVSTPSFPTASSGNNDEKYYNTGFRNENFYISSSSIDRDETSYKTDWIIQQRAKQLKVEANILTKTSPAVALVSSQVEVGLFGRIKNRIIRSPSVVISYVKRRLSFQKRDQTTVVSDKHSIDKGPDGLYVNEYDYYQDFDDTNEMSRAMSPAESRSSGRGRTAFSNFKDVASTSSYYDRDNLQAGLRVLRQEILPSYEQPSLFPSLSRLSTVELPYSNQTSAPIALSGTGTSGLGITSSPVVGNVFNIIDACFSILPFSKKEERQMLVLPVGTAHQQTDLQFSGSYVNMSNSVKNTSLMNATDVNTIQSQWQSNLQPLDKQQPDDSVAGMSQSEVLLVKNDGKFQQQPSFTTKNDGIEFITTSVSLAAKKSKMALAAVSKTFYNTNTDSNNDNYTVSNTNNGIYDNSPTSAHLSLNTRMQIESDEDIENLVKQGPLDYTSTGRDSVAAGTVAGNMFSRAADSVLGVVGGAVGVMVSMAVNTAAPLLTPSKPSSIDVAHNVTEARNNAKSFMSLPEGSLPWDVHFRAPIPFFENALKGPEGKTEADYVTTQQGKQLTQNLLAQFIASDAIDEKSHHVDTVAPRSTTHTTPSNVGGLQGFFVEQAEALKNRFSKNDSHNDINADNLRGQPEEVKTEVSQLIKDVFPLVTNTVKAIDGMRQQLMDKNSKQSDTSNSDVSTDGSKPKVNALNMVQKSSIQNPNMNGPSNANSGVKVGLETGSRYRAAGLHSVSGLPKGSALPGDGIGLGLGLDPEYVDAVRHDEVLGIITPKVASVSPSYSQNIDTKSESDVHDASEVVLNTSESIEASPENVAHATFATKKEWLPVKLAKGIYKYTAKPVIQAPWILVRWIRNKHLARRVSRESGSSQLTAEGQASRDNNPILTDDAGSSSWSTKRDTLVVLEADSSSNQDIGESVTSYDKNGNVDRASVDAAYFPLRFSLSPVEANTPNRIESVAEQSQKTAPTTQGMTFLNLNFPLPLPMRKNMFSTASPSSSTSADITAMPNTGAASTSRNGGSTSSSKEDLLNILLPDPFSQLQQEPTPADSDARSFARGSTGISMNNTGDVVSSFDTSSTTKSVEEAADVVTTGVAERDTPAIEMVPAGARDLRAKPQFVVTERIPIPTKADFAFIEARRIARAVSAARAITNEADAREFMRDIGINVLLSALNVASNNFNMYHEKSSRINFGLESTNALVDERIDVVIAICRLLRMDRNTADILAKSSDVVNVLVDMMERPFKRVTSNGSSLLHEATARERERDEKSQRQAVALMLRILRSSDVSINTLKHNSRLRNVLQQIADQGSITSASNDSPYSSSSRTVVPSFTENNSSSSLAGPLSGILNYMPFFSSKNTLTRPEKSMVKGNITIADYPNLKTHQMARVASWALGGVPWKPRQHGQKGLRILSLDGGGTKGVLTVALLKELMHRINKQYPHEVFDIICGTSTGAIIAALLGLQMRSVEETEDLYDDLIDRIFSKKSNLKLLAEQASYDEQEWERILYALTGEEMMLDSNRYNSSRVFMVSTKLNNNPPGIQIWRNYNYAPHLNSRYGGSCRVNVLSAVRATTAAPTFFTPIPWQGGLYGDGALVANNPTAIALQEAKLIYPGVPIELVVSIGTGLYSEGSNIQAMGWDLLVNHIIATSVSTEDVHVLLTDFLPPEKYFRFNPMLQENVPIDVLNKTILADMKRIAKESFVSLESGHEGEADTKRFETMIENLKGSIMET